MKQAGLKVEGVTKRFDGKNVVNDLSLEVASAEIVALLGPSGCGKSTLLRLIAGLESADAGLIQWQNRPLTNIPPHQRGIGMMFQSFALFPHLSTFENVAYGLRVQKWTKSQIQLRVSEMLSLVDLKGYENRPIATLSGGEQQRIALARSLATNPALLLLDEPLGALDRALREQLMIDLRLILKRVGVTAIFVTHDQAEAFAVADQIVVMNQGKIEQIASPAMLYAEPATSFVARFLGFENLLKGRVIDRNTVETEIGRFSLVGGHGDVNILIRPNALIFNPSQPTHHCTIDHIIFRGRYYQIGCTIENHPFLFEIDTSPTFAAGDIVPIAFDQRMINLMGLR